MTKDSSSTLPSSSASPGASMTHATIVPMSRTSA